MTDLTLGNRYLVQLIGIFKVLPGNLQVFICQQQVEKIADRVDRHSFHTLDISGFRFLITDRLDTPFPFLVVHTENRLRKRQPDRYAHIFVENPLPQLPVKIERRVQRYLTTCQGYILIDRNLSVQAERIVLDKSVRTVGLLVFSILFTVGWKRSLEVDLRQLVGNMRTVFPISSLQLVQGHCCIHRLHLRQVDRFF